MLVSRIDTWTRVIVPLRIVYTPQIGIGIVSPWPHHDRCGFRHTIVAVGAEGNVIDEDAYLYECAEACDYLNRVPYATK